MHVNALGKSYKMIVRDIRMLIMSHARVLILYKSKIVHVCKARTINARLVLCSSRVETRLTLLKL